MITHQWVQAQAGGRIACVCARCRKRLFFSLSDLPEQCTVERCQLKPLTATRMKRTLLGERYWVADIDKLGAEVSVFGIGYAKEIRKKRECGKGLFLWGGNGTGKTYLAAVLLKEALRVGFSALFLTSRVYLDAQFGAMPYDGEKTLRERATEVDFLVLDDFGKEGKVREWGITTLENLLRHRAQRLLSTIITTNLEPGEVGKRYANSISSILREAYEAVCVSGVDRRV